MYDELGSQASTPAPQAPLEVGAAEFKESFGEDLSRTLDLDTWRVGEDLAQAYARIEAEIRDAVAHEDVLWSVIRARLFPRLAAYLGAPPGAGVYDVRRADLERIHRDLLFSGRVEACDGTRQVHDTLPLTIHQIGVSLVSYQGDQGSWGHRLYRRDLRMAGGDPIAEMAELLERREAREGPNQPGRRDTFSDMAGRAIMAYAERALLLHRSTAHWRMGHGSPAPYELITGSGSLDLMIEATRVIRALVEDHKRFIFVASEPNDRLLLTIGQALKPMQFAIVRSLKEMIDKTVDGGRYHTGVTRDTHWDGVKLTPDQWIKRFRDVVAPKVVVGVYRATRLAGPQVFYAHADHFDVAAHIAIADSILQEHRGFPLLIDLAASVCRGVFGGDTLTGPVATAYTDAGATFRYLSERAARWL